jgi:hypothetical protein
MEEDAKSKLSDIEKLRKILDNPDDNKLKDTLSKNKNLDSIRRRLQGEKPADFISSTNPPQPKLHKETTLEPRVTIHEHHTTVEPQESPIDKPSEKPDKPTEPTPEKPIEQENLVEIEKPEQSPLEFLLIQSTEESKSGSSDGKPEPQTTDQELKTEPPNDLPEWLPVTKKQEPSADETPKTLHDTTPQWDPIDQPETPSEIIKDPGETTKPPKESTPQWEPIEQQKEPTIQSEIPIQIFAGIPSINSSLANELYNHGYTSIDKIRFAAIADLTNIKGIRKKTAKQIKKDIENLQQITQQTREQTVDEPGKQPTSDTWKPIEIGRSSEDYDIQQQIEEKNQQIQTLQLELQNTEQQNQELKNTTTSYQQQINELSTQLTEKETQLKTLIANQQTREDTAQQDQQKHSETQQSLAEKTAQLAQLQNELSQTNQNLTTQQNDVKTAQTKLQDSQQQLRELTQTIQQDKELLTQIEDKNQSNELLLQENATTIEQLQTNLETKTQEVTQTQQKLTSLHEQHTILQQQITEKTTKITTLTTQLEALSQKNDTFDKQVVEKDKIIVNHENKLKQQTEDLQKFQQKIIVLQNHENSLEQQLKEKEIELQQTLKHTTKQSQPTPTALPIPTPKPYSPTFSKEAENRIQELQQFKTIDRTTAEMLYGHGITSAQSLIHITIKDLQKIKGMKRRTARKIRKELDTLKSSQLTTPIQKPAQKEFQTTGEDADSYTEWESYDVEETQERSKERTQAYTHGEYTLYKKEIVIKNGSNRTVHFFSKKIPDSGKPAALPEGYIVKINKKTGLPYIKKQS